MNIKNTIPTLSAILALAITVANAFSQNFNVPQNMGAILNTTFNETGPTISPDGLSLYFASNRPGFGANDIFVSHRATLNSAWGAPQNLGATLNSSFNDNVASFSLDGLTMFLQSNRSGGMGMNDIYISTRKMANNDFGWTVPVNLGANINSAFSELNATYFEDPVSGAGSLIFSSDRIAMDGVGFRFYQSTRNPDGSFNVPVMIDELNGDGGHFGSAIRRDGLEIYIGSARPGGLNLPKFDIYVSTRASTSAPWNTPMLATGINGFDEDRLPKLSPDGSVLYFNSDRSGGFGGFDLYSATRCSLYAASPCYVNRNETADFDGDGRADISIFRPSDGSWWVMQSGSNTVSVRYFGAMGDKIVPGDYDGDGRTDMAVFRPSDGNWYILRSSDALVSIVHWGVGTDKPVPADYDGDARTDIAVNREGAWYILRSSDRQFTIQQFGLSGDIPVSGVNVQ